MGERARSIGSEAETKAWNFLRTLGYRIEDKNNEQYDIDCIAVFPSNDNKSALVRPRFAPDGLTAFEVTEETLRKRKVTNFKSKIERYNTDNPEDRVQGGILLVDQKISPKMIGYMKNQDIWGWGLSRQRLYKEKWGIFHAWKETLGLTMEVVLDENASYLVCSTPPPTKSDKLLHFAIFLDDDFHKLSLRRVIEMLDRVKDASITPLTKIGISPINIHIEFHSVGGLSAEEEEFEETIAKFWKTDGINIIKTKNYFFDYRTFSNL